MILDAPPAFPPCRSTSKRGRHTSDAACGFVSRQRGTLPGCSPRRVGRCRLAAHTRLSRKCRRGQRPCYPPLVRRARSSRADAPRWISAKALGVTEQGAQDCYHRQTAKQEECAPEFPPRLGPPRVVVQVSRHGGFTGLTHFHLEFRDTQIGRFQQRVALAFRAGATQPTSLCILKVHGSQSLPPAIQPVGPDLIHQHQTGRGGLDDCVVCGAAPATAC
ncbi:hypothetical protein SAMN05444745_1426 [Arthrobacter sp. OV608]|nr:hypothetical protein SAMN05444745_1426 [Arthrobacter sp. OV608]